MHAHKLNSNDRNSIAHTYNALRKNWRWQHLELGTKTHGHSHQEKLQMKIKVKTTRQQYIGILNIYNETNGQKPYSSVALPGLLYEKNQGSIPSP